MTQQQIAAQTGALGSDGNLNVYTVPGSVIATPVSAAVIFDGTNAAGPFLPCLTFKTQTGAVIARCPAPGVAAGAIAEVSWFPSVGGGLPTPNTGGNWADYTPTWTSKLGANPAIGNGTLSGTYFQVGKYVVCHVTMVAGSTTTFGGTSGNSVWRFSLPVTGSGTSISFGMSSNCVRGGGTLDFPSWGFQDTATAMAGWGWYSGSSAMAFLNNAAPWSWAAGDRVLLASLYEAV